MNGVTFTNNVTQANRDLGLQWLKFYYNGSVLAQAPNYPITNYTALVNFLDTRYATYIEFLGETASHLSDDQMQTSMRDLQYDGKTSYPTPSDFANAILKNTGWDTTAQIDAAINATMTAVGDTALSIGSFFSTYGKYIPYAIGGAVALYFLFKSGAASTLVSAYEGRKKSNPIKKKKKYLVVTVGGGKYGRKERVPDTPRNRRRGKGNFYFIGKKGERTKWLKKLAKKHAEEIKKYGRIL